MYIQVLSFLIGQNRRVILPGRDQSCPKVLFTSPSLATKPEVFKGILDKLSTPGAFNVMGPEGVGKTYLLVEAAAQRSRIDCLSGDIFYLDLRGVKNVNQLLSALSWQLCLQVRNHIHYLCLPTHS